MEKLQLEQQTESLRKANDRLQDQIQEQIKCNDELEIGAHLAKNKLEDHLRVKQQMKSKGQMTEHGLNVNSSSSQTQMVVKYDKEMQVNLENTLVD